MSPGAFLSDSLQFFDARADVGIRLPPDGTWAIRKGDPRLVGAFGSSRLADTIHVTIIARHRVDPPLFVGDGVTDADLVLGYLDPSHFLGGDMKLDLDAVRSIISTAV